MLFRNCSHKIFILIAALILIVANGRSESPSDLAADNTMDTLVTTEWLSQHLDDPDLVVLDIKMVDYNGLDLLQDIRNKFYDLPVILSTAYDTFKEDMKSIAADFYVVKSFDLTELKKKILMALEASGGS